MWKGRPQMLAAVLAAAVALSCSGATARVTLPEPPRHAVTEEALKESMSDTVPAKRVIARALARGTPHSIAETREVLLQGTRQWITVRGQDRRNPIILFLHGGPGYPMLPAAWTWQAPLEEYFTMVQWDQRGSGKTFLANDASAIAPTMNIRTITQDAFELIELIRK